MNSVLLAVSDNYLFLITKFWTWLNIRIVIFLVVFIYLKIKK